MRICIPVPKDHVTVKGNRFICWDIPILVIPWWKKFKNPGDPIEIITDGGSSPN